MTRGDRITHAQLVVAAKMLEQGCGRLEIAKRLGIHRCSVGRLWEQCAVLWLRRWEADRRNERIRNSEDAD
jgi:DNA invertase Pin-like site-specific DNA recombinase